MSRKHKYHSFIRLFIILIAFANFARDLCFDFTGDAYQSAPIFPPDPLLGSDFQGYPYYALCLLHGIPIYEERNYQDHRQRDLDQHYKRLFGDVPEKTKDWYIRTHPFPWNFPPLGAYLALPFTKVARPGMYRILLGLLLAALLGTLALLSRYAGDKMSYWMAAAALVAFSYPLIFQLERGGLDMFALLLVTLGFFALREWGSAVVAGLCFAFAIHLKLYPLIFLYYFVIKREWRVSLSILLFTAFLMVGCAVASREGVVAGFSQYAKLYRFLRDSYAINCICYFAGNHSTYNFMRATCERWSLPPELLLRVSGIINLSLLAAISFFIIAQKARDTVTRLLDFSLIMLVMTVTPPEANDYSLVFLYFVFLSCFVCLETLDFNLPSTRTIFFLFSLNAIILFLPTMTPPFLEPPYGYLKRFWFISNKWPFLISLMVIVCMLRRAFFSASCRDHNELAEAGVRFTQT
ncbi:MAG: glycosyltransferase family 87 protein [Candidatus Aureabacteria bacterium]|nr:glycosyltransferase family 87 protein [Candidatus Auribacterota bacterium]